MITVKNLTKRFGKQEIIEELSFSLAPSHFLVVTGPSGSGKTTLLRLIAGLETPDNGEIWINGTRAAGPGFGLPPYQRRLGFVFQTPALWPHMTVEQNIGFGLKGKPGRLARERVDELLEQTSIQHLRGRYPDEISGGEARRVALARSLAPRPDCLLMDEPLTNLGARLKDQLLDFMVNYLRQTQTTLMYVTHDPAEADRISDSRITLDRDIEVGDLA